MQAVRDNSLRSFSVLTMDSAVPVASSVLCERPKNNWYDPLSVLSNTHDHRFVVP